MSLMDRKIVSLQTPYGGRWHGSTYQWEYEYLWLDTDNMDHTTEILNKYGLMGWELVQFIRRDGLNGFSHEVAVFKRLLPLLFDTDKEVGNGY